MAWKTFVFYEPNTDAAYPLGKPVEDILTQIELQDYDIRFVFKETNRYTVLARKKAH